MTDDKPGTLQEHEKFWAFVMLVMVVLVLVIGAAVFLNSNAADPTKDIILQSKLRIIDAAVGGLLAITGMAAQALFRVSSVDKLTAETALVAANKLPEPPAPAPQPVEVVNTPEKPANVTETHGDALPDYAK